MQQYNPSNLVTGEFPVITQTIKVAAGQVLNRGAVLGQISTSNLYVLSQSGVKDGSEKPSVVLAEDVDASQGEIKTVGYLSGQFNTNALTLGAGHTPEKIINQLRQLNIYLTNVI